MKLVAMLGLVPSAHEMEMMENAFSCVQERPGNETSYTYESSELSFASAKSLHTACEIVSVCSLENIVHRWSCGPVALACMP